MIVSSPKILLAAVETEIINPSDVKSPTLKRCIDDVCSLWILSNEEEINTFIELEKNYYPTIKSTAETSDTETTFLDTCVYKGERFKESILDELQTDRNFPIHTLHLLPPSRL